MGNRCTAQADPQIEIRGPPSNIGSGKVDQTQEPKQEENPKVIEEKPIVDEEKLLKAQNESAQAIQSAFRCKVAKKKFEEEKQMLEQDKPKDWQQIDIQFQQPELPPKAYEKINKEITNENRKLPLYQAQDGTIYNGQWKNGQPSGYGQMIKSDKTYLEGQWKKGILINGAIYFPNGDLFLGESQIGVREYHNGVQYSGDVLEGIPHGQGKEKHPDNTEYDGEFIRGQKHGKGQTIFADHSQYNGEYNCGQIEGQGTFIWPDGQKYTGHWKQSMMNGQGELHLIDGRIYKGEFSQDQMHGNGIMIYQDGTRYEGQFANNKRHGKGKIITKDNKIFDTIWNDGQLISTN